MKKVFFKISMVLLVIGGLNWLAVGAARMNGVEALLGRGTLSRFVYGLVGIAALWVMFDRDTYLPFLGETVFPCSALRELTPRGADTEIHIQVPANRTIIYWAAEPNKEHLKKLNNWRLAYLEYENVGVTTSDSNGSAVLRVRKPQGYTVPPFGKALNPHVHYRVCGENALVGRVETVFLSASGKKGAEGFEDVEEIGGVEGKLLY